MVIFQCDLTKMNKFRLDQKRTFALTDKAIYNINKQKIKGIFTLSNLVGITRCESLSKEGKFIIHARHADFYYKAGDKTPRLIPAVILAYAKAHEGKELPLFAVPEPALLQFYSTKDDHKKGLSKMPNA